MSSILLGTDRTSGKPVYVRSEAFSTHARFVGATGTGKTTLLHTLTRRLMSDPRTRDCHILIDLLGGQSDEMLQWVASPYCPEWVRGRFLYVNMAREDRVIPFHPLNYTTEAHGFFRVGRATECILRGSKNQDLSDQPRTATWMFNTLWAEAKLNLTVADSFHLIYPGSPYHRPLLDALPPALRAEWVEVLSARGGEAMKLLESVRNRFKPFVECSLTRNFFGSTTNRFDVHRFMREGMIVLVNLAPQERLSRHVAHAVGGMIINEVFAQARSLDPAQRRPTYLWLDEFQNFVGPDLYDAVPEVRQLKIRLILAHQSFSQLVRGETDLTALAWQPRFQAGFALQGEDADLLAHEVGTLTFDPKRVKDELYSRRQLLRGHRIAHLCTWSEAEAEARNWSDTLGSNWGESRGDSHQTGWQHSRSSQDGRSWREGQYLDGQRNRSHGRSSGESGGTSRSTNVSAGGSSGHTDGGSRSSTRTQGAHETLVPEYENFLELTRRTYYTFEEQRVLWAQAIRRLKTGQAVVKLPDDPTLYEVDVARYAPGYLEWDREKVARRWPQALDAVARLTEANAASDFFVSPHEIERETRERLERVLRPTIRVRTDEPLVVGAGADSPGEVANPVIVGRADPMG